MTLSSGVRAVTLGFPDLNQQGRQGDLAYTEELHTSFDGKSLDSRQAREFC